MNEIILCPGCRRKLQLPEAVLGQDVQCPTCNTTFAATLEPPLPPARAESEPPVYNTARDDGPRPSRRRRPADYDEDEEDDRFRRRRRRNELDPPRGNTILTLGVLSIIFGIIPFVCIVGLVLGGIAWGMGHQDLNAIRDDRMDPEGEGPASAGRICGILGTILGSLWVLFGCVLFLAVFLAESTRRF